jgi:hypothetical protein
MKNRRDRHFTSRAADDRFHHKTDFTATTIVLNGGRSRQRLVASGEIAIIAKPLYLATSGWNLAVGFDCDRLVSPPDTSVRVFPTAKSNFSH